MEPESGISGVAHLIQLSVAPVFLILGIGGMLSVMTNRLARVIDRARVVDAELRGHPAARPPLEQELNVLSRRAQLVNTSITLCTITAMLICALVAGLFVGAFLRFDMSVPVATLFIAAMVTFFFGLLSFLREIFLATANLRIGHH